MGLYYQGLCNLVSARILINIDKFRTDKVHTIAFQWD